MPARRNVQSLARVVVSYSSLIVWVISCAKQGSTTFEESTSATTSVAEKQVVALACVKVISGQIYGKSITAPGALLVDQDGNVFVIDAGNSRIIKFDKTFAPLAATGVGGSHARSVADLGGIALDNNLNLCVTDRQRKVIAVYDRSLNFAEEIRFIDDEDPFKFGRPNGISFTTDAVMWVTDMDRNRIAVFDRSRIWSAFYADYDAGGEQLQEPSGVGRIGRQRMGVCDAAGRIVVYDYFGAYESTIGAGVLRSPRTFVLDNDGRIWVADAGLDDVLLFDSEGALLFHSGPGFQSENKPLAAPSGITFAPDGHLYISDTDNNRILICRIVSADGSRTE